MDNYNPLHASILAVRLDKNIQSICAVKDFSAWTNKERLNIWDCAYLFIGVDPKLFNETDQAELWAVDELFLLAASEPLHAMLSLADFTTWARNHESIGIDAMPKLLQSLGLQALKQ